MDIENRVSIEKMEACAHMESYVSALSDGSLSGLALWYTRWHLFTCRKCSAALRALRILRERLWKLGQSAGNSAGLSGERRSAVEKAMDDIDSSQH
jgi:hypothetical protein